LSFIIEHYKTTQLGQLKTGSALTTLFKPFRGSESTPCCPRAHTHGHIIGNKKKTINASCIAKLFGDQLLDNKEIEVYR